MMKGILRLYPESPIVWCGYDENTRKLQYLGFGLGQPHPIQVRKDMYGDRIMVRLYAMLLQNKSLIYATCYNMEVGVTVSSEGLAQTVPLFPEETDFVYVNYINSFENGNYYPNEPREIVRELPTYALGQPFYTEPAYELYFPNLGLNFDGIKYYRH